MMGEHRWMSVRLDTKLCVGVDKNPALRGYRIMPISGELWGG